MGLHMTQLEQERDILRAQINKADTETSELDQKLNV